MLTEWVDSQKIVLGYIFKHARKADLQKARMFIHAEFFTDKMSQFWKWLVAYEDRHNDVMSLTVFRNLARAKKWGEPKLLEFEQVVAECEEAAELTTEGEFSYYIERLGDIYKEISFHDIMTKGSEKLHAKGFVDARDFVLEEMSLLEKVGISYVSEVELKKDADSFISTMRDAKLSHSKAIFFGLPSIDNAILGLRNGDLCLIAAFTGVGKTGFCVNTGVNVCFVQNKNVVYVTTETTIQPLTRRVYARLSKLDLFDSPIASRSMKAGTLSVEESETLLKIQQYLKTGQHGCFMMVQAPPDANLAWLRGRLLQYEASFNVDLVIIDDLRNMRAATHRRNEWEEFNDLLKGSKSLARTHAGKGVPIISPYQISREGQRNLDSDTKRYKLTDLSSSSEAERSPDVVASLIQKEEDPKALTFHIMKQRDGETGREFELGVEFEHQYFYEKSDGTVDL